ncbi:MAG: VanZ family protein [Bacteroidales bacterium]|nr:VanZ family protein [Bacteroidales bacterium]
MNFKFKMNYEKYHYLFTAKRLRLLFGGYLFFLILMALLPINSTTNTTLTDVFVINIRLDHLLHATLFIPWAFLYIVTFRPVKWDEKLLLVIYGLLMASATEGVQYFLTYRSYNINDMIANWTGVVVGMGLVVGWRKVNSE